MNDMATQALLSLSKRELADKMLLLPCKCYGRLVGIRGSLRTIAVCDPWDCEEDPQHRISDSVSEVGEARVEVVAWWEFIRRTFTPGRHETWMRGCVCPEEENENGAGLEAGRVVDAQGHAVFVIRRDCILHGSKFACEDADEGLEYNTVPRVLSDLGPLDDGDLRRRKRRGTWR